MPEFEDFFKIANLTSLMKGKKILNAQSEHI